MALLFSILACLAALSAAGETTLEGSCEGGGDDCIDGYVSLLQESASLLKQARAREVEDIKLETSMADLGSAALQSNYAVLALIGVAVLLVAAYLVLLAPAAGTPRAAQAGRSILENLMVNHDNNDEIDERTYDSFEEDSYSLAVALIVRDLHALSSKATHNRCLRYSRLAFALGLVVLTISLQVTLLACTKMYVTPQAVASIRDSYDQYEVKMYNGHTYLNKNGKHRGIPAYFNISAFGDLDGDLQQAVCNIPLSQVTFISLVLLVWAITCMAQLKKSVESFMAIAIFAQTTATMAEALTEADEDDDDQDDGGSDINDGIPVKVITGLTAPVKAMLTMFIFMPDFATTAYVMCLGSRWLVATNDFGNVISNAVALEFILMLKCLLFYALVSDRNKRDLAHTGLAPPWDKEPAGYGIYFNTSAWVLVAIAWVYFYIHNQQVLPDYKWDVHAACSPWLAQQLDPDAGN